MVERPEDYLKKAYSWVLVPNDDGRFSASILEFPGCFTEGNTAEEALANLREAAVCWLEAAIGQRAEVPAPSEIEGASGKFVLRLPRMLHQMAIVYAKREGTSLNQFVSVAVAERVGVAKSLDRLERTISTFLFGYLRMTEIGRTHGFRVENFTVRESAGNDQLAALH